MEIRTFREQIDWTVKFEIVNAGNLEYKFVIGDAQSPLKLT